jgi:hypothetical protein
VATATIDTSVPQGSVESMETEETAAGVDSGQHVAQIHATAEGPAMARPEMEATSTDAIQHSSPTESPSGEGLRGDTDVTMVTDEKPGSSQIDIERDSKEPFFNDKDMTKALDEQKEYEQSQLAMETNQDDALNVKGALIWTNLPDRERSPAVVP